MTNGLTTLALLTKDLVASLHYLSEISRYNIEVVLDRTLLMQGYDSQLEAAIKYIERKVQE